VAPNVAVVGLTFVLNERLRPTSKKALRDDSECRIDGLPTSARFPNKVIAMRVHESEGMKFELKIFKHLEVLNSKNSRKQTCDLMQRDTTENMTLKNIQILIMMSVYQRVLVFQ